LRLNLDLLANLKIVFYGIKCKNFKRKFEKVVKMIEKIKSEVKLKVAGR
jgi:hypothetical protein